MEPLVTHVGKGVPLRRSNVDTDSIYPAEHALMQNLGKTGHADDLMWTWRKDPDFVLNRPQHAGASVLVAGKDFGTGSSREWAVWALVDYGFRVIFSPRFGDIFRGNAAANGLVAGVLPESAIESLWAQIEAEPERCLEVDLEHRVVAVGELRFEFEYPDDFRWRVMNGLDDIEVTQGYVDDISEYEGRRRPSLPRVPRTNEVA